MTSAPEPIRRTLEVVCLLLGPSTVAARGRGSPSLQPPSWGEVQHLLRDTSFLQRVRNLYQRRKEMDAWPMLAAYVADVYFVGTGMGDEGPLTYDHVVRASQTQFGLTEGKGGPIVTL